MNQSVRKVRLCIPRFKTYAASFATATGSKSQGGSDENKFYSSERQTHFGFENVTEEEKAQKVRAVFENVADGYDKMNDFMSAGVHRVWKDMFVHRLKPGKKTKLIDVAGGTGDIAFRFLKHVTIKPQYNPSSSILVPNTDLPDFSQRPDNEVEAIQQAVDEVELREKDYENNIQGTRCSRSVLICDINPRMLEVGRKRAESILSPSQMSWVSWLEGDAENLYSIPDNTFDVYTIAFGIRNCVHIDKVLEEAYRILRPGGRFMCLEFSHVTNPAIKWAYDQYSFQVIPAMGQIVAGDWDSYLYLVQSIRKFPLQEEFKSMIGDAGFRFVSYENLTFGVAAIHSGFKV